MGFVLSGEKQFSNTRTLQKMINYRFDIKPASKYLISEKVNIISCVAKHYGIFQVKAELDQMLCGLSSTLNMLELIRNPTRFRPLLELKYSPQGSNTREKEEATTMLWLQFLQKIQSEYMYVIHSCTFSSMRIMIICHENS